MRVRGNLRIVLEFFEFKIINDLEIETRIITRENDFFK